jgi:nitrile hydratase
MAMTKLNHNKPLAPVDARAQALKDVLIDKGLISEDYIQKWEGIFEEWVPENGAKIVARAWTDPGFKDLLLKDATKACSEMGFGGVEGGFIVALENTPSVQNVIVCTLCSCTAWPILGLPPEWYKGFEYRSRIVREPRKVLHEMGYDVDSNVKIQVWDTTAETRYMVLPQRPAGTEGWSKERLEKIVTKDSLIGVAPVSLQPAQ